MQISEVKCLITVIGFNPDRNFKFCNNKIIFGHVQMKRLYVNLNDIISQNFNIEHN